MRELRDHLSRYLERVKAGEGLTVTEHGRPIAHLVAPRPRDRWDETARWLWHSADRRTTSVVAYIEARAAIAAAGRDRRLSIELAAGRLAEFDWRWGELEPVGLDDEILGIAGSLADDEGLRPSTRSTLRRRSSWRTPEPCSSPGIDTWPVRQVAWASRWRPQASSERTARDPA